MVPYSNGDDELNDYPRPKLTSLPRVDSSITIMGVMHAHCPDYLRGLQKTDNTFFQIIRNHHEVIIVGPPLLSGARDEECAIQLALIETLLHTVSFDEINYATLYITGDGRARLIPQICTILPEIPFISGVRCIEESELRITSWLYIGWKLALLDGMPVEVDYAFDIDSCSCVRQRIEAMRRLLPLDLATPLQAFLISDGAICGFVAQIEDSHPMTCADRSLVYSAFGKLQRHHIYLTDAIDYDPDDLAIVGDKVRFIRAFTGNWDAILWEYDPDIHNQEDLEDARETHWRVAEKLFNKLAPGTEIREFWATTDFTIRPREAYSILNIIFSPERPLDILVFMASITSRSGRNISLSKKKRLKGSSPKVAATNRSVAGSFPSSNEACHPSSSDKSIDSSTVSDKPLSLPRRFPVTRPSVFLYGDLCVPTTPLLPYSTRLGGVSSIRLPSSIRSVVPLPPDDSDAAWIQSSHGWLEEVP